LTDEIIIVEPSYFLVFINPKTKATRIIKAITIRYNKFCWQSQALTGSSGMPTLDDFIRHASNIVITKSIPLQAEARTEFKTLFLFIEAYVNNKPAKSSAKMNARKIALAVAPKS
jgi:hypothetical protein